MEKCLIINGGTLSGLFLLGKNLVRDFLGHEPTDEELYSFDFVLSVKGSVPSVEVVPSHSL